MKEGFKIAAIVAGGKGIVILGIGLLFKLMHWPNGAIMMIIGGILVVAAALLIFISLLSKKK